MAMAFIMSLFAFGIFYLFSHFFITKFSFPLIFIWAIPLAAFMTFCHEMVVLIIRNRENPIQYMKVNMARISLELGLAVVLIVLFSFGWLGRVSGLLIALSFVTVFAFFFLIKNDYLFGKIKKKIIYSELKYSGPIITMQLSMFCLFSSDSFILSALTKNNAEVGIYGIACIFGSIIITLGSALNQYMIPKIHKELASKNPDYNVIKKLTKSYIKIMIIGLLVLLTIVPLVYKLVIDPIYWEGSQYFYMLCTGYFFWTISAFLYTFLLFHKKKSKLFILAFISILISLIGNFYFIQSMGAWGASISVCLSYFLVLLLAFAFTKKYLNPIYFNNLR
jgi:O-antigen/teichoic acid export membrane protein